MSSKSFDPFDIEPSVLTLGEHAQWTLGEMHDMRVKEYAKSLRKFLNVVAKDDVSVKEAASAVGDLVAAVCLEADGAKTILVDLSDVKKHGEKALGLHTLRRIVRFISTYARGEELAGEA